MNTTSHLLVEFLWQLNFLRSLCDFSAAKYVQVYYFNMYPFIFPGQYTCGGERGVETQTRPGDGQHPFTSLEDLGFTM